MAGRRSVLDIIIDVLIFILMLFFAAAILYPFLNALAISFNHADDTALGGITFFPRVFAWESYRNVITNPLILRAYLVTIYRTFVGTVLAVFVTGILAFGLSHSNLVGRKYYSILLLIPMYFGGGLIPTFLMFRAMGLFNNPLVYIVPNLVGLWNVILMRTFFQSLPSALEESAKIDGANYLQVFFRIIIPVSMPIIATIALFNGIFHWNDWFFGTIYIVNPQWKPMQNVLLSVINDARQAEMLAAIQGGLAAAAMAALRTRPVSVRSITMATMFVTIFPVLVAYPFLQRYFIKGMMIGSIKG
jgi:putative aldouronate transport system permease protein